MKNLLQFQHPEEVLVRWLLLQRVVQDVELDDALLLFLLGGMVTRYLVVKKPRLNYARKM